MLLTLTTDHRPATDLGFLLHKHPDRFQSFDLSFGQAHVFYPEAAADRCTACLMLDVDPVGMVRRKGRDQNFLLGHYVNDRPYVASSFMSVAISQVFGTAMGGRCKDRPELVKTAIPLEAKLDVLPVRAGEAWRAGLNHNNTPIASAASSDQDTSRSNSPWLLHRIFEPLGYSVEAVRHPLDERFPEWGESSYYSVTLRGTKTLSELLTHLYVLIPVFDNAKPYFVGEDELDKLLAKGAGWLASHPEKEQITRRYLKHRPNLFREALARLVDQETAEPLDDEPVSEAAEESLETPLSLNEQRHGAVLAALRASGARSVLDLGCGEGKLLRELLKDRQFEQIVGLDVSIRSLELAQKRLRLDQLPPRQAERIKLLHGSLIYRDRRLEGFDAAAVVEVIEHLDPPRLSAFERVLFEFAHPKTIVLTTPNREYNVMWPALRVGSDKTFQQLESPSREANASEQTGIGGLPAGHFRHADHRFEWTRQEFQDWANSVAGRYGYTVRFLPVGPEDERVGSPTQLGWFAAESMS